MTVTEHPTRWRSQAHIDLLARRVMEQAGYVLPETRFRYDRLVATGEVDRAAWAELVQELLDLEAAPLTPGGEPRKHGAKTRFAARVGLKTPRTIDTWLRCDVDVKEVSVRQVAEGYGLNAVEVFVRLGLLKADQLPLRPIDDVVDDEIQIVLDNPELDDEQRMQIIEQLEAWRAEDRELQQRLAERDKRTRAARLAQLIEQANRP